MKILLLSFHFPPDAPLAATRAPKLARYLLDAGHDLRVLCANDPQNCVVHTLPIAPERVIRTDWRDLRAIPADMIDRFRPGKRGTAQGKAPSGSTPTPASCRTLRNRVADTYDAAICRPDRRLGWRNPALAAAKDLFESWVPDVIYATCPPHSSAVIAERIARLRSIPFITEFRDRWALNAYSDHPGWRQRMDQRGEQRVLSRAAGIVTVSPLWAEDYATRYGKERVTVSMNGYDPREYPLHGLAPNEDRDTVHLLHAGALYPKRRDPRVLFAGIAALGQNAKHIRVTMMGKDIEPARVMAQDAGVADQLTLLPPEPHAKIIARQYETDALLLMQWNDERDAGTVPGKLFEAIGARRPVIATGYAKGVTAGIVRERGLGTFANEPSVIANALAQMLTRKRAVGMIPPLPESVRDGFSCTEQFAALDPLFHEVADIVPRLAAAE